jgi:hypothetical protein
VRLPPRPHRAAIWAGAAGPVGFLLVAFLLAWARIDIIDRQGWVSWPSSMALGGAAGVPMIAAFLWLGGSYAVFALGALRPAAVSGLAVAGYLVTAAGDLMLAAPTDPPSATTSWHGAVHLLGVLVATGGTLVVALGLLRATAGDPDWRALRPAVATLVLAAAVGLAAGFDHAWAKVAYVVGITLPAAVVPWCLHRSLRRTPRR